MTKKEAYEKSSISNREIKLSHPYITGEEIIDLINVAVKKHEKEIYLRYVRISSKNVAILKSKGYYVEILNFEDFYLFISLGKIKYNLIF